MTRKFAFRRTKIRKICVLQERHDRYIHDSFCYVSDIYINKRLLIAVKLTKSRLKKCICNPLYTVHVIYLVAVEVILQVRNNSNSILHTIPVNPLPDDKILDWSKLN